jgi:transcriptional regulator with XRE-family HTH domain
MKRYKVNGKRIKELRSARERASTQKEFAHEVRISERRVRLIENTDAELKVDDLERLGKAFGVPWQSLVFTADGPQLVSDGSGQTQPGQNPKGELPWIVIPRFETALATAVMDAEKLLSAVRCHSMVFHLLTGLTAETEVYADKVMAILKGVHKLYQETGAPFDAREEIRLRRELRELLILLKGNDVWVYETSEFKHLPESYEVQPRERVETLFQSIIAFGPAGEYGENTVKVPVDHGAPWLHNPNLAF